MSFQPERPLTQSEANEICRAILEIADCAPGEAVDGVRRRMAMVDAGRFGEDGVQRYLDDQANERKRKEREIVPDRHGPEYEESKKSFYNRLRQGGLST